MKTIALYFRTAWLVALTSMFILSCNNNDKNENTSGDNTETPETPDRPVGGWAEGADIGWLTEMESMGIKFKNASGEERDGFELMKEIGFDAVRLRVWVDPDPKYSTWCGKEDVLNKARRAWKLGLRIMVDFHYSDRWADPANQYKPRAWESYSQQQLCDAVSAHTKDILEALKAENITPEWVQVGNETANGMLWPEGKASENMAAYAKMTATGYDAVKAIFPDAQVIVHLDHGDDSNLYQWIFKGLKDNGGKWDVIGMSLYPEYYDEDGNYVDGDYKAVVDRSVRNAQTLYAQYNTPFMYCEVGMSWWKEQESYDFMKYLMEKTKNLSNKSCLGIFYWEPQCNNKWKPEAYESLGWNGYDKGAFNESFAPTKALDIFKD